MTPFPVLRWAALAFVLVLVPAYAAAYGPANFVFLCNLSVFLTAIGLWTGSRLLLSSQAVGLLAIAAAWTLDLALRLLLGRHLIGGTEYMWDARFPLVTRLLSFYHVAVSAVLLYALRRLGYDRRGYLLQSAIAVAAVSAGRLAGAGGERQPRVRRSDLPPRVGRRRLATSRSSRARWCWSSIRSRTWRSRARSARRIAS